MRRLAAILVLAVLVGCGSEGAPERDTGAAGGDVSTGTDIDASGSPADAAVDAEEDAGDAPDAGLDTDPDDAEGTDADKADADKADAGKADAETDAEDAGDGDADGAETDDADADADAVGDGDADDAGDADADDAGDADADDAETSDADADAGPALPFPADAFPGPVQPTSIASLPAAALAFEQTVSGIPAKGVYMPCSASGFIDGDDRLDAVLIRADSWESSPEIWSVRPQPGGAKVAKTPVAMALHIPNGGCTLVDLDGDGLDDLLAGGSSGLLLYHSKGDGTFAPVPEAMPDLPGTFGWTMAPADLDGDGDLDLFVGSGVTQIVCDAIDCGYKGDDFGCSALKLPPGAPPKADRVLLQTTPGVFADATAVYGVPPAAFLSNVIATDLDDDPEPEVLIGNDFGPSRLLDLQGGAFVEATPAAFPSYLHGMGWGVGDLDGDGDMDLVGADAGPMVLLGHGPGPMATAWQPAPPGHPSQGLTWTVSAWNPQLLDLDQDGSLDIYLGVAMDWGKLNVKTLKYCSFDYGTMTSTDLLLRGGAGGPMAFTAERGATFACGNWAVLTQSPLDLDLDGDLDLLQTRPGCTGDGGLSVVRNQATVGKAAWLRLVGPPGNRPAIGASVTAKVAGKPMVRRIEGIVGVGSSPLRLVQLGLGTAAAADEVVVHWPDGSTTDVGTLAATDATTSAPKVVSWQTPPIAPPVALPSLPEAALADITATFGLPLDHLFLSCAAVGHLDGDGVEDVVLIAYEDFVKPTYIYALTAAAGGGKTVSKTAVDTSLIFPTGGCALVDTDSDGDDDLLLGGSAGLVLYRNDAGKLVLDPKALPDLPGTSVQNISPADFDRDGDLDLFVSAGFSPIPCNNYQCNYDGATFACYFAFGVTPKNKPIDRLLLQDKPGHFVDATTAWGVPPSKMITRAIAHDADDDGWPDVVVGNDFGPESVLRNTGTGSFESIVPAGFASYAHGMGWGVGDLDGDGDFDLVHADGGPTPIYHKIGTQQAKLPGPPAYLPVPPSHPIFGWTWTTSVWAPLLDDFDQDGGLDLFLGVAMDFAKTSMAALDDCKLDPKSLPSADLLLLQPPGKPMTALRTAVAPCGLWGTLTESLVDIDGDGDLDIVQIRPACTYDGVLRILRNDLPKGGDVVRLRLLGKTGNLAALGARVWAKVGDKVHAREPGVVVGTGSVAARDVHIGLGSATQVDSVQVRWPDGSVSNHGSYLPGAIHVIAQP